MQRPRRHNPEMKAKFIFLWTAPRSCSSAFERSITTLQGITHSSEPFSQAFYFGEERQNPRYKAWTVEPNARYEDIARTVLQAGDRSNLVFVKDMAYFMEGKFDILAEYFKDARHSFLIRDPTKAIRSLYRGSQNAEIRASGWDYFDPNATGFKQMCELYNYVKQNLDPDPVVVDADDLLESPREVMEAYCRGTGIQYEDHMIKWEAGVILPAWFDSWASAWRRGAIDSTGFCRTANSSDVPDVEYPDDVIRAIEDSRPFYEELYSARIRIEEKRKL